MRGICRCVSIAVKPTSVRPSTGGANPKVLIAGVAALLRLDFRKHERDVVDLVAPQVHVRIRVEDPRAGAKDVLRVVRRPREAHAWRDVVLVRVDQPLGIAVLAADEGDRRAVAEIEVREDLVDVVQRRLQLVAQAQR